MYFLSCVEIKTIIIIIIIIIITQTDSQISYFPTFSYSSTNEIPTTSYTWSLKKGIPFLKGFYFSEVVIV